MPGLHDAHIHGITEAADACSLELRAAHASPSSRRASRRASTRRPTQEPDGWLRCPRGTSSSCCPAGTVVTKEVLDGLRTRRPIVVASSDGHTSLVNSRGLALAGITAATPDPSDGRIEHARGRAAQRPAAGRREATSSARCCRRRPATRSTRRGAGCALRARGHHVVLRPRLRRRRHDRRVRPAAPGGRPDRPRALRDRPVRQRRRHGGEPQPRRRPAAQALRAGVAPAALRALLAPRAPARAAARGRGPGISIDGVKLVPRRRRAGAGADRRAARAVPPRGRRRRARAAASCTSTTRSSAACCAASSGAATSRTCTRSATAPCASTLDAVQAMRRAQRDARLASVDRARRAGGEARPAPLRRPARPAGDVLPVGQARARLDRRGRARSSGPSGSSSTSPRGSCRPPARGSRSAATTPSTALDEFFAVEVAVLREADWGPAFPQYAGRFNRDPGLTLRPGAPRHHDRRRALDAPGRGDRLARARQARRPDRAGPRPVRDPAPTTSPRRRWT